MAIIQNVKTTIDETDGVIALQIKDKLKDLLSKNPGFERLRLIASVLNDDYSAVDKLSKLSPEVLFKNFIFIFYCIIFRIKYKYSEQNQTYKSRNL